VDRSTDLEGLLEEILKNTEEIQRASRQLGIGSEEPTVKEGGES